MELNIWKEIVQHCTKVFFFVLHYTAYCITMCHLLQMEPMNVLSFIKV